MSNQQNDNVQLDDDIQGLQHQPVKYRPRNFYRRRPGNDRKNQDLGEDENHPVNDDDVQQSNNSDDDNENNNTRGRGRRGGFRRGRGRGRFSRGIPFYNNYRQGYSPYTNYVNGRGGFFISSGGFYGAPYHPYGDLEDQEGSNGYPIRGNRAPRGGRGRGGRRRQNTNTENTENNNNNTNNPEEQEGENTNTNKTKRRQRRRTNDNGSGTEQQTDDQQQDENNKPPSGQRKKKNNRRRHRNTNASQTGTETEERVKSEIVRKPKDDETIVKYVVRNLVNKVARRLAPRNRQRSRANTKEGGENHTDVEQSQTHKTNRRGGRGKRAARPGNGYFIEQGYYDPYGMSAYYYGAYRNYGGQGFGGGRGRGRGGRGRGRGRRGGANKENQPQDNNSDEKKIEESKPIDDNLQTKTGITEQVNQ